MLAQIRRVVERAQLHCSKHHPLQCCRLVTPLAFLAMTTAPLAFEPGLCNASTKALRILQVAWLTGSIGALTITKTILGFLTMIHYRIIYPNTLF